MKTIKFSIVIPVFNSTDSLQELIERIDFVFKETIKEPYEIIMIDDGSFNPETWIRLTELSTHYDTLKAIQLTRNFGKAGAVLCGLSEASGKFICIMDDDLQHRPEDIPILLTKKAHDIVFGNFTEKKHSFWVRLSSEVKGYFDRIILNRPSNFKISPFCILKAEIAKALLKIKTPHPFIPAMMFYVTKDVVAVNVVHSERKYGISGFTIKKRFKQFSRLLINNSSLLLQVVSAIGILIAFFSALYSIVLIYRKLYYSIQVSGWTSLMVTILVTSGLILFSIGIVGEYLIRIINGVEQRPPFLVREKIEKGTISHD